MALPTQTLTTVSGEQLVFLTTQGTNQVPYLELLRYQETFVERSTEAMRTCLCLWEDRYLFVADMLGNSTYVPGLVVGGVQSNLSRQPPESHPELDWLFAVECKLADTVGVPTSDRSDIAKALTSRPDYGNLNQVDPSSNMVAFNLAQFDVTYTPRDYIYLDDADVPSDGRGELNRYVSRYFEPAGENVQVPAFAFKFVSDNETIQSPPAITMPLLELRYLWRQVPALNYTTIENTLGKVNASTFDQYYAPETLLCLPPKMNFYYNAVGTFVVDLEFIFLYRRSTWNALYRKAVGVGGPPGFDRVVATSDGVSPIYPTANFDQLFVLP
jgi:hypothetical protein